MGRVQAAPPSSMAPGLHPVRRDFAAGTDPPPFTSRKYRAQAVAMGPWPFASFRASGSAGPPRSRRRSHPCREPTALPRTHCISPRNSAPPGTKCDARPQTDHPQIQRSVSPDIAPARTSNVNASDSPLLIKRGPPSSAHQAGLWVPAHGTNGAVPQPPRIGVRNWPPGARNTVYAVIKIDCLRRRSNPVAGRAQFASLCLRARIVLTVGNSDGIRTPSHSANDDLERRAAVL